MFDTHTHVQFKTFDGKVAEVIERAHKAGVNKMIVVGTNLETSKKAVELANQYEGLYASVGLHPHHIFGIQNSKFKIQNFLQKFEELIKNSRVVAVGETGLDRHIYENTKYQNYKITEEFIELQKSLFKKQIKLALKHKKSLVIHNREAVPELLEILEANWDPFLKQRSVFHCCEPDQKLLDFALKYKVFIGIDGDITYDKEKQEFMKKTPLELLVLETDSPYFVPEPLISEGVTLNEPKNLKIIAETISRLKKQPIEIVREMSSKNSHGLFQFN